ncbi:exo-beta-N-acetylmuramidase NamZ family protein [Parvicella tangerina]|uniref:DUF1343 domain-containing protein n=1 Tax=Parvicella tangerina TaxID=2829795 RepID=A0A916JNN1_9FLAO|nr:DUF1343 domain-containing protein [Parvicella tangerina]CAG5084270.1 hypothetical protein CRYO30217_02423 [Parvicella tangerina]
MKVLNSKWIGVELMVLLLCVLPLSIITQNFDRSIITGAERVEDYLPLLKDKKVGIVTNQTGIIKDVHLVDSLLSLEVDIVKVFAPEHGFRGKADAGEKVNDEVDEKTGLPILSLYGKKNRKPSVEKLIDVDVLVFDLQDVGARFYTYISTLHYVMEACAEQNKPLIILDRPNPNGFYVDGPVLKKGSESFIGMHPVPIVHGMTIGEYAQMINGEKWLKDGIQCPLTVVKCAHYKHSDLYELPVAPSPNLPNMAAVYLYPSLCLFEGTDVSVGRGTTKPFQQYGAPYLDSDYSFVPEPMFGAKHPKREGETCYGIDLQEFGLGYLLTYRKLYLNWLVSAYDQSDKNNFFRKDGFFTLLTGDPKFKQMIENGMNAQEVWRTFHEEAVVFKKEVRSKYLLYEE